MAPVLDVQYCFRCGRRVNPQVKSCWYCAAPTQRVIRPPRQCPFCMEPVQHKAIKCPHCGEFLDGRAQPQAVNQPHTTYVIEKAVIQHGNMIGGPAPPMGLPGAGGNAPRLGGPSNALPRSAGALPSPVRGLPAPDPSQADDPIPIVGEVSAIDVQLEPSHYEGPPAGSNLPALRGPAPDNRALVHTGGVNPNLPAHRVPGQGAGSSNLPALPLVGPLVRFMERFKKEPVDESVDISALDTEHRYKVCEACGTEVLTDDNFCYHCGVLQGSRPYPQRYRPSGNGSNFFIYVVVLVCMAAAWLAPAFSEILPGWTGTIEKVGAFGAPLLSAVAFVRGSGFFSRLIALVFFLASLVMLYYVIL